MTDKARTMTSQHWWGLALSVTAIMLALFSWFFLWAHNEYHGRGRYASMSWLYLPDFARNDSGVYSEVSTSLLHRGLFFGLLVFPVSIVELVMRTRFRWLAFVPLAMVILPVVWVLVR